MITTKKDQLLGFSSSSDKILKLSMRVLNKLQDDKPGDITVTLALLMLEVLEAYDCDVKEIIGIAHNMRTRTYKHENNREYIALKEYIKHELVNR